MLSIAELKEGYAAKQFTPAEIIEECLQKIHQKDESLCSLITAAEEEARRQAESAKEQFHTGRDRPLEGVPITYKDIIDTKGIRTTNGAWIDRHYVPEEDAAVVRDLCRNGAITLGKANLHEYAFGVTSRNPFYGYVKNPWNPAYMAGGSSGGSAAAIAAGFCYGSIATDTAGSIRMPASCSGITGLKPTYGSISTEGVFPLSWSLDHVGPMGATVKDTAFLYEHMRGKEKTLAAVPAGRKIKIGVPRSFFNEKIDEEVSLIYKRVLRNLETENVELVEVDVNFLKEATVVSRILAAPEVTYIHEHRADLKDYGEDIAPVFEKSRNVSSLDYVTALQDRNIMKEKLSRLFTKVDVLITPTLPVTPPLLHDQTLGSGESVDDAMIRYTCPFNLTGHPALTMPAGLTKNNMPIGIQMVAGWLREDLLLDTAMHYEARHLDFFYQERSRLCSR
ncbi:amidase [Sinobaca sp. H24]|uniref:amidase n=1 Tax=Sinobaca sp. H24 TaxID=2923376 RepID=UPI0020796A0E|nr:amidase [Sinobaca sp. H24]